MTDKRAEILAWLTEQEALCAAAMDAPWAVADTTPRGCYWIVGRAPARKRSVEVSICGRGDWPLRAELSAANGRFIAASRTVLPLALAALRAEVEAHGDLYGPQWCSGCGGDVYGDPTPAPCPTIERIHRATVDA